MLRNTQTALTQHIILASHEFNFHEVNILDSELNYPKRKILESVHIWLNPMLLNIDQIFKIIFRDINTNSEYHIVIYSTLQHQIMDFPICVHKY